jgi:hypothetical protein
MTGDNEPPTYCAIPQLDSQIMSRANTHISLACAHSEEVKPVKTVISYPLVHNLNQSRLILLFYDKTILELHIYSIKFKVCMFVFMYGHNRFEPNLAWSCM